MTAATVDTGPLVAFLDRAEWNYRWAAKRKQRAGEPLSRNGLVQSWPEIVRLAEDARAKPAQAVLL